MKEIIVAIIGGTLLLLVPFLVDKTKNQGTQIIPIEEVMGEHYGEH